MYVDAARAGARRLLEWLGGAVAAATRRVTTRALGADMLIEAMFTGLIEAVGEVVEVTPTPAGFRLRLDDARSAAELTPGDSLAVNGVCLTVVSAAAGRRSSWTFRRRPRV